MNQQGYITVNDVSCDFKGLGSLTTSSSPTESQGLFGQLANLRVELSVWRSRQTDHALKHRATVILSNLDRYG